MATPNAEKLHHLDLGVARFTEFSITVVLTEWINADFYQGKLRELAAAWPVLSTRLDRIVSEHGDLTSIQLMFHSAPSCSTHPVIGFTSCGHTNMSPHH